MTNDGVWRIELPVSNTNWSTGGTSPLVIDSLPTGPATHAVHAVRFKAHFDCPGCGKAIWVEMTSGEDKA